MKITTKDNVRPVDQPDEAAQMIQFTHWLSEMRAELAQSVRGTFLQGALAKPLKTNQPITTTSGSCVGFSVRNLDGAQPATIQLFDQDQPGTSGDLILTIQLAAGESNTTGLHPGGVGFGDGLYAVVTTAGAGVEGSIWLRAND